MNEKQILPYLDPDGVTVRERHVYSGEDGDGYIDIEYKKNGNKIRVKTTHYGPEESKRPKRDKNHYPEDISKTVKDLLNDI